MGKTDIKNKPLPVGKSFFDKLIEEDCYYVDKTLFIKDLIDMRAEAVLCTRPRRFGKTLNQTMLKCFFEDTTPIGGKDTRALFHGLKIEEAGEQYMEHQGKYPVIYLSFKDTKFSNFDEAYKMLMECIAQEFERHAYVSEKVLNDYDRDLFKKLSARAGSVCDYYTSLKFLSACLENYHGKKTVILIDEYDVPLENSWVCGFYDNMTNFIRPLLSSALKDNQHLKMGVITGCLRVSRESIFTGLNNLDTASVLDNKYSGYFGFTQREVDAMLNYYGFDAKTQIVRDWYNGYLFGNTEVYNPWSCLKAVDSWITDINERPRAYWVNTSGNDIIHDMIDNMNAEAKAGLETLMA
ncbi:MAG: AAA family ATPase, partial [Chitinispirillales bacterium]|nr:AAA family ATPase [Chitinispirillales bacterium]